MRALERVWKSIFPEPFKKQGLEAVTGRSPGHRKDTVTEVQ